MTSKYDKVLTDLLSRFYTDSNVEEEVRRIVQEVINAEMNELDSLRPRVIDEIMSVIEDEAKEIAKNMDK